MDKTYHYILDFTILPQRTPEFEWSFAKVIEAHMYHPEGLGKNLRFYRSFSGGSDVITLTIQMKSLGEMDLWKHTPEIVIEHYGNELGVKILQLYCDTTLAWKSKIIVPYNPLEALEEIPDLIDCSITLPNR